MAREQDCKRVALGAVLVAVVTMACLLPFVNKAFTIDDTVFVVVGRHILSHPLDFFGFDYNWSGTTMPMHEINMNPPGVSYFIALVIALFGERELPLHVAFLFPAAALAVGTFLLARRFTQRPVVAALCGVLTPAFLVSGSTVMSDVLMVALYVWAVLVWLWGLDKNRAPLLVASGLLIVCSALTKYYGGTAILLLGAYTVLRARRLDWRVAWLALPVALLIGYQVYTGTMYGSALFSSAAEYASNTNLRQSMPTTLRLIVALTFVGGCLSCLLFFPLLLQSWSRWLMVVVVAVGILVTAVTVYQRANDMIYVEDALRWPYIIQWGLCIMGGLFLLSLSFDEARRRLEPDTIFLLLWIFGTFAFSAVVNWTVNVRTLLPMAPALGILIARRLDDCWPVQSVRTRALTALPLLPGLVLGMAVAFGDYTWANSVRDSANGLADALEQYSGNRYYTGHWGFQYYMDKRGFIPLELFEPQFDAGDFMVVSHNNIHAVTFQEPMATVIATANSPAGTWVSTMKSLDGTGFYSERWGLLPFAFGKSLPDMYTMFRINQRAEGVRIKGLDQKDEHTVPIK